MPPKRGNLNSSRNKNTSLNDSISKNASIVNMFKRIESNDSNTVKCEYCKLFIKSCLLNDHVNTKCQVKMKLIENERRQKEDIEEIVIIKEVSGTGNCNKKAKISESVIKKSPSPTKFQHNLENNDFHSTPKKLSNNDLRLSIYENEEERSRYIKDEKQTPIKNNDGLLVEDKKSMPQINEKTIQEEEEALIVDSENFQPEKLVLSCLSDSEVIGVITKVNSDSSDGKLSEIQEPNIPDLTLSAKKRNIARKSTSIYKYDQNIKENVEKTSQELSSSDSNNDILMKLDKAGYFDENSNENMPEISNSENQTKSIPICYALKNFVNAIETVFDDKHFVYLLNDNDLQIVDTFNKLNDECKKLYVRLFQRKFRWIQSSNMNYENISANLEPYLNELKEKSFLQDENSIETYEEIIDLLKLPQLKQLAKQFHIAISQNSNRRVDYVNAILKHFKTQKGLNFSCKKVNMNEVLPMNSKYMNYCKNLLGKCYKLNRNVRDVFVRILMLYSLSSTHHIDQNNLDSGQQQLFQILMVNIGKLRFMDYFINLDNRIYENRESFINYQIALEYESELIDFIENKEFEKAYEEFEQKLYIFKQTITDIETRENDSKLPNYLRKFSANSIYCKILSIYATEILQRMKFYKQANELFEFLLFKQDLYLLDYRHRWIERLAINFETHLKDPYRAMEILKVGLEDKLNVRKAGRLALYQRTVKMSQIKRYAKIDDLSDRLNLICEKELFIVKEAPIKKIEGNLLQPEIIPGRKTIFVQNSSQSTNNVKNIEICSVEQIALSHYIKNEGYTNGKHAETGSIMTIFGLLFWDILFESNISCVFIDRFQTAPLDLNTDYFYLNRKELVDKRIIELKENNSEFTFNNVEKTWNKYHGTQCSLVNWDLFEDLDELKNLFYCFTSEKLAALCEYIAKNYRYCRSGGPDLILWSVINNDVKFVEVKGPGDKLSFKQIVWLDFLQIISISCEVCYVKGTCSKRLRECE